MATNDWQFKLSVVQTSECSGLGLKVLAGRYGPYRATGRRWVKGYQQHGLAGRRTKFSHYSAKLK